MNSEECKEHENKIEKCYGISNQVLLILHIKPIFEVPCGSNSGPNQHCTRYYSSQHSMQVSHYRQSSQEGKGEERITENWDGLVEVDCLVLFWQQVYNQVNTYTTRYAKPIDMSELYLSFLIHFIEGVLRREVGNQIEFRLILARPCHRSLHSL